MSLLDLLYFEDGQSQTTIAAVHRWCDAHGFKIGSEEGQKALVVAERLAKSTENSGLLRRLSLEMAASAQPCPTDQILVVEDEPFIALDMEEVLNAAGLKSETYPSCAAALRWLTFHTPLAAILDFQLKGEVCTQVASLLLERGVPMIFCSGADRAEIPSHFQQVPWLRKPFDDRQLTGLLTQALEVQGFGSQMEKKA
ncbi:response regulator [Rhizobium sp. Root483D2]|uniref:response regulator n=1 Tax=Rhizobium sp. Root483D2 TaxID=1736545 RepID=UPI000712988C|nr:response regulator [Rhizobium sp. Root483D2]KQY48783.1 hypothetical protein ASD32_00255 [Rhizobium sp. Root483D2]